MTPKTSTKSLSNFGTEIMTRAGWTELWNSNSHKPLPRGLADISDKGYARDGCLLFVEEKGEKEKLSDGQKAFEFVINSLGASGVMYLVVRSEDEYIEISNIRKIRR